MVDSRGVLWLGMMAGGLVRYDAQTGRFHTWRPDQLGRYGPYSEKLEEFELFAIDRLRGAAFSWLEKCTQPGFLSLLPAL